MSRWPYQWRSRPKSRAVCHLSCVGFDEWWTGCWKGSLAKCSLVSFVSDADLGSMNRCQARLSASVEPANPFASSEPSVQATIIADGMTIWLILEAARLDMHLIRLCFLQIVEESGPYLVFLPNLEEQRSPRARRWVWPPCMNLRPYLCTYWLLYSRIAVTGRRLSPKKISNTICSPINSQWRRQ